MTIADQAKTFACAAHRAIGHKRKYTGQCYTVHLAEVANYADKSLDDPSHIAVAWLHDVIEDTYVTEADIVEFFGSDIARGVMWLTDQETGNRATRKALSRQRLAHAPPHIQTIKCADLISNTRDIKRHDPKFARVYLEEKRLLLEVMTQGDDKLFQWAQDLCKE